MRCKAWHPGTFSDRRRKPRKAKPGKEADLGLGLRLEFYGLSDWNASKEFFDYPHQSEAKSRNDQTSQWLTWSKRLGLVVDVGMLLYIP